MSIDPFHSIETHEVDNVDHLQGIDSSGDSGADSHSGNFAIEGISLGDFLEDPDAELFDCDFDGASLDFLDSEEGGEFSHDIAEKLSNAAQSIIPHTRKRGQTGALAKITVEDFDTDTEKQAFLIIKDTCDVLFSQNHSSAAINAALEFFFKDTASLTTDEITFDLCCDVLQSRADILRLRIQYEWWRLGSTFNGPFPFDGTGTPELLQSDILNEGGFLGMQLANEIWVQPSITTEVLTEFIQQHISVSSEQVKGSLAALEDKYLISLSNNGWYLTGRNPMLQQNRSLYSQAFKGGSFGWSGYFRT